MTSATPRASSPVEVKICGLRSAATMAVALEAGADYVGLVFFAKSPRNVSVAEAAPLAEMARGRARIVALTVDPTDRDLDAIVAEVRPDIVQLHGHENPDRVGEVRARTGLATMKAIGVATAADAARALAYRGAADLILFDAKPAKDAVVPGGNGIVFDWQALAGVSGQVDWMLSGGLTPDTVAEAIRLTGATRVDVSSGVERAPGLKDPALIRAFLAAAKGAKQTLTSSDCET